MLVARQRLRSRLVLSLLVSLACFRSPNQAKQSKSAHLSVHLTVLETPSEPRQTSVLVKVTVTGAPVTNAIPTLRLHNTQTDEELWAPFDLAGKPLSANKSIPLEPASQTRLDLDHLLWAKALSPLWPSRTLEQVVPPATYYLEAHLSVAGNNFISNRITITIERRQPSRDRADR